MSRRKSSNRAGLVLIKPNAQDSEFSRAKNESQQNEIEDFACNLEIARMVFQRHPELVTAEKFPDPYRKAILSAHGYDPNEDCPLDISDLHIVDPRKEEIKNEAFARRAVAGRHATVLEQAPPVTQLVQ